MQIINIHTLVGILIAIDVLLFGFVLLLLKRSRRTNRSATLSEEIMTFEALVRESDHAAVQFNKQLQEKHQAVKTLNDRLDKRIHSLNLLVNRADAAISRYTSPPGEDHPAGAGADSRQTAIRELTKKGFSIEEIARKLSIQRGEVTLVLNMK